jgi:hypothetical protein
MIRTIRRVSRSIPKKNSRFRRTIFKSVT